MESDVIIRGSIAKEAYVRALLSHLNLVRAEAVHVGYNQVLNVTLKKLGSATAYTCESARCHANQYAVKRSIAMAVGVDVKKITSFVYAVPHRRVLANSVSGAKPAAKPVVSSGMPMVDLSFGIVSGIDVGAKVSRSALISNFIKSHAWLESQDRALPKIKTLDAVTNSIVTTIKTQIRTFNPAPVLTLLSKKNFVAGALGSAGFLDLVDLVSSTLAQIVVQTTAPTALSTTSADATGARAVIAVGAGAAPTASVPAVAGETEAAPLTSAPLLVAGGEPSTAAADAGPAASLLVAAPRVAGAATGKPSTVADTKAVPAGKTEAPLLIRKLKAGSQKLLGESIVVCLYTLVFLVLVTFIQCSQTANERASDVALLSMSDYTISIWPATPWDTGAFDVDPAGGMKYHRDDFISEVVEWLENEVGEVARVADEDGYEEPCVPGSPQKQNRAVV